MSDGMRLGRIPIVVNASHRLGAWVVPFVAYVALVAVTLALVASALLFGIPSSEPWATRFLVGGTFLTVFAVAFTWIARSDVGKRYPSVLVTSCALLHAGGVVPLSAITAVDRPWRRRLVLRCSVGPDLAWGGALARPADIDALAGDIELRREALARGDEWRTPWLGGWIVAIGVPSPSRLAGAAALGVAAFAGAWWVRGIQEEWRDDLAVWLAATMVAMAGLLIAGGVGVSVSETRLLLRRAFGAGLDLDVARLRQVRVIGGRWVDDVQLLASDGTHGFALPRLAGSRRDLTLLLAILEARGIPVVAPHDLREAARILWQEPEWLERDGLRVTIGRHELSVVQDGGVTEVVRLEEVRGVTTERGALRLSLEDGREVRLELGAVSSSLMLALQRVCPRIDCRPA